MGYLKILDSRGNKIRMALPDFEGAGSGRRLSSWGMSSAGPNNTLFSSLGTLRSRSRELVRNDPQIDGALNTLVSNLVGMGISPRWQIHDSQLKKQIQALWADWILEADADGILDFYGLQSLVTRSIIENGEVFVRFRPRRPEDGLSVPLQLQVLEGDHLDPAYNTIAPNGNEVRMGIEFDAIGRRAAYWMFREHPGESFLTVRDQFERVRIPAEEVMHIYRPLRAGQKRGMPWLASVLVTMHELNQFNDAELVRKKTAAMFGGFITQPPEDTEMPSVLGNLNGTDESGSPVIDIEPGTFPALPPGYEVTFSTPADVGGNYESFVKHQERRAARGLGGLTYEKFTGDLSGVNYSSIRAGNLEFQRQCKQFIYNVLAFQFCRPVARYWLNQAYLANAIDLPGYAKNPKQYWRIKWTIDGWPWVDPLKDLNASKGMVRAGFSSRTQEVAERGLDVEELEAEIAADNERADAMNLVFDSDTRKTDISGRNYSAEQQQKNNVSGASKTN
jgi:lambda family phage portal protein